MSNNIKDKKGNYMRVKEILSSRYEEVGGYDWFCCKVKNIANH